MTDKFIYLASPYSHKDPAVRQWRFERVCEKAAELMDEGHLIYCPIAHSHCISQYIPGHVMDEPFWYKQNKPFLEACDELWIYPLPGWEISKGVSREVRYVVPPKGKRIRWLDYNLPIQSKPTADDMHKIMYL